jgi:hypothetical protein
MTQKNVEVEEIPDSEDLGSWVRFSKTETETLLCLCYSSLSLAL